MMKNKKILSILLALCAANFVFAENIIYEQETIKTYTMPLKDALNDDILLSNVKSGRIKAIQTDSTGVVYRQNINSNDIIRTDNMIIFGKNVGENQIKTHNELLQAIKINATNMPNIDIQKIDYLLNLLKIEEGTK